MALQHGELATVSYCGFHFILHRLALLDRVGPDPFNEQGGMAEDWAFCDRVRSAGSDCHREIAARRSLRSRRRTRVLHTQTANDPERRRSAASNSEGSYAPNPHLQRDYGVVVNRLFVDSKPELNAA
jgi:hypothetical protein